MSGKIKSYPNQRIITVHKEPADKNHKYTVNTLSALDEAAGRLQSAGGFKLYVFLSKNQDKYKFALSSKDFFAWSGLGKQAYMTAFRELEEQRYLIKKEGTETIYTFYDKSQKAPDNAIDSVIIEIPAEKVNQISQNKNQFIF